VILDVRGTSAVREAHLERGEERLRLPLPASGGGRGTVWTRRPRLEPPAAPSPVRRTAPAPAPPFPPPGPPGAGRPPSPPADPEEARATLQLPLSALPWALVVRGGRHDGLRCPIGLRVRVGRVAENELAIPEAAVSRHHAVLEPAADGWSLVDLGSANGTWVNGRRVSRAVVTPRDRIRFGDVSVAIEPD
jgi:hypothetical protein